MKSTLHRNEIKSYLAEQINLIKDDAEAINTALNASQNNRTEWTRISDAFRDNIHKQCAFDTVFDLVVELRKVFSIQEPIQKDMPKLKDLITEINEKHRREGTNQIPFPGEGEILKEYCGNIIDDLRDILPGKDILPEFDGYLTKGQKEEPTVTTLPENPENLSKVKNISRKDKKNIGPVTTLFSKIPGNSLSHADTLKNSQLKTPVEISK